MVVGSGLIGSRFKSYSDNDKFIIFASGVSNSANTEKTEFKREKKLLLHASINNKERQLVYFSTCSIYDNHLIKSLYVKHKLEMEQLVSVHTGGFVIFRVSNPVGFTSNHHTFFNFFIEHIETGTPLSIWSGAERNLIDLDDMYALCDFILQKNLYKNTIVNIANSNNYTVLQVVKILEQYLHKKAQYTLVNKTSVPVIDTSVIAPLFKQLGIKFNDNYLWRLLEKYFPYNEL